MSEEPPPWREITTDDYHPRIYPATSVSSQWIASCERIRDLLQRQHDGEFRLRLILREAMDLKRGPKVNPLWFWDYDSGPDTISCVTETWIQAKDGRRRRVGERGFAR